ncbi:MAG: ATP-dependent DNA helicase RecG [Candidatus Dormibacteraeota bacterium]|nr:ATP-dependent DNA helicase RecG [Candidatus Dormibacteraeota bacterium]
MAVRSDPSRLTRALRLDSPVEEIPRATRTDARLLRKLGIETARDLLLYLPHGLDHFERKMVRELLPEQRALVVGTVVRVAARRTPRRGMDLTEATLADDEGGHLGLVWFNQPYLARQLRRGERLAVAEVVKESRWGPGLQMQNPEYQRLDSGGAGALGDLMPKYHLTGGLSPRRLSTLVERVMPLAEGLEDVVPEEVRQRQHLLPVAEAVRRGHRPESDADLARALQRMTIAELLEYQAAFWLARSRMEQEKASRVPYRQEVIERFKAGLGFELTHAQRRATWDVYKDMDSEVPMNRLLDGDVGSGKTAVAAAAAAMAHAAGLQTMVMAPTEILARQHLNKFRTYLEQSFEGLTVELLVSGLGAAERRRVRASAASGHCAVLVGTHALIEEDVEMAALGLAVVDEQHRFGTRQRELLRGKSGEARPHFLCMSATPIPRSLALALYGEMALSTLDEMPPGRTPVATEVLAPEERERAYDRVRTEVAAGRQAFVICPLVEASTQSQARAATAEFERLRREVFPDLRLALVHGRMKDKDSVMRAFRDGESDVLVATAVIEVGVDVPNATVMLIEGAERFGLAQLHQFRGRVGRGSEQSYCLLLSDEPGSNALRRLRLVAEVHDGFELAGEDMDMRGAGELMGERQHGMSDRAMRALRQPELLSEVRDEVERLAAEDPSLGRWPALRAAADRRLAETARS